MQSQPEPTSLPSPLSYANAVSRPAVAPKPQRAAKLKMIALMLMELTGCSRADALAQAQAAVKQLTEGRDG